MRIVADVHEVVDSLIDHNWNIWAEDGKASKVAPQVIPTYRLAFCTIAYHVTGEERFKRALGTMLLNANRASLTQVCQPGCGLFACILALKL